MFRDEYTNFSFNELESENFKVWITNKNDLKRNMSPNFSDKFNTPTGSQIRYHEGTTIDKQDFKLSCAAIDVTLNEWRAITEWLSPLKQGKLRFEWNDKYYYMVKISKAPSGTMFMKGRVDDVMGQLYIITFDLEFTTVHDWAALGNYAEQNSIKEIDMSVYNNEYCIPSIIMRDKYIYRTALKDQTLYPSGDVVIVSSGNANDFALLDSDTEGIESLVYNKVPLPTTMTFKHGFAPVIAFWDYNQGSYSQPITICADTFEAMEDLVAEVRTEDFVIRYSASYDIDKNVVLTLYTEGMIDDYENKFVLINVIDNTHPDYRYPATEIDIDQSPTIIYVGETYTIKAQAYNTLRNINWSGTSGINIYSQEDGCKFSIPADWDTNQVINIVATIVETYDETVTKTVFDGTGKYAKKPELIISSNRLESGVLKLGVEESIQLDVTFHGLNKTYFEWVVQGEDLESISISDLHNPQATITGLKLDSEVTLYATGRTNLSDENDVSSNLITVIIINSTVELRPDASSVTPLRLGQDYKFKVDVIGETDQISLSYTCTTKPNIQEELDDEVTLAEDSVDRYWTIKSPSTLIDLDGNELMETTCIATVTREFEDGREDSSDQQEFTWFKGIEIQNINSFYPISSNSVPLTNCIKYNYFNNTRENYTVEWLSSDTSIIAIEELSDGDSQLTFENYGEATITCTLLNKEGGIEVDSTSINVEVIDSRTYKWNDEGIIHYQRNDEWAKYEEICDAIFDFELDDIINNIVQENNSCVIRVIQREDGWYELAYLQEQYYGNNLVVYVDLSSCGFSQSNANINSIKELLTSSNSYDAVMRVKVNRDTNNNITMTKTYYVPNTEWKETITSTLNLSFLGYYAYREAEYSADNSNFWGYLKGWSELKGRKGMSITSTSFEITNDAQKVKLYYPKEASACYGYIRILLEDGTEINQIMKFESYCDESDNQYDYCLVSSDVLKSGTKGSIHAYYYHNIPFRYFWLTDESYFTDRFTRSSVDLQFPFEITAESSPDSGTGNTTIIIDKDNSLITLWTPQSYSVTEKFDFSTYSITAQDSKHHAINSIYETTTATPAKFSLLRRRSRSLDFPNGGTPQLGILSMENNIIGYVYNTTDKTYYRHYLADGTNYWDELIGTPSYYQFQSHPTYSLLNHNFQDSVDTQFNSALTLTLKANNNTVICNTGVFNMYPLFFVKGGCHIKDSLYEYYSFLTNTNMKNLFVTINSRTSTMLHNGYAIDGSYNSLGKPLFKDIKNENQLLISSGRPELLKAVLISDEEIEYSDQQTGRRIAKFLINTKPMYGLRNKFAMHIFNESFKDATNIYNKTGYNALSYYNTMNNIKHILIDSPAITFEQEPGGWTMSVSYRSSDKGLSSTKFHDFIRHSKRTEETQYDEYSNVGSIAEIAPKNSFVYISVCDYKELDILSEGEDYSVGCQARGVI